MTEKTRRLKKYEAEPVPLFKTEGTNSQKMNFYSPFGPMIAEFQLPPALIEQINHHANEIVIEGESMEFILPADIVFSNGEQSLAIFLESLAVEYVKTIEGGNVQRTQLDTAWIVSQYENTASPMHFHSSDISGVLYLKEPAIDLNEENKSYLEGRKAGQINFMSGGKQGLSKSLISFKPKVGMGYIFPGWLLHGSEPFIGSRERRSLAFNLTIIAE